MVIKTIIPTAITGNLQNRFAALNTLLYQAHFSLTPTEAACTTEYQCKFEASFLPSGYKMLFYSTGGSYTARIYVDILDDTGGLVVRCAGGSSSYNGEMSQLILYADTDWFAVYNSGGYYEYFLYVGALTNGDSTPLVFSTSMSHGAVNTGVVFLETPASAKGKIVTEQREIRRNDQICETPIYVTDAANNLLGSVTGISCVCVPATLGQLSTIGENDIIRFTYGNGSTSAAARKLTGIKIGLNNV